MEQVGTRRDVGVVMTSWEKRKLRKRLRELKPKVRIVNGRSVYFNGWIEPTKEERKVNSRGNAIENIDGMSIRKWCSACGEPFETVNPGKRFCNPCFHKRMEAGLYDNTRIGKELISCIRI